MSAEYFPLANYSMWAYKLLLSLLSTDSIIAASNSRDVIITHVKDADTHATYSRCKHTYTHLVLYDSMISGEGFLPCLLSGKQSKTSVGSSDSPSSGNKSHYCAMTEIYSLYSTVQQ